MPTLVIVCTTYLHQQGPHSQTFLSRMSSQAVEERVDEVRLPLEDELAAAYAGHQEEKALRESDRRWVSSPPHPCEGFPRGSNRAREPFFEVSARVPKRNTVSRKNPKQK